MLRCVATAAVRAVVPQLAAGRSVQFVRGAGVRGISSESEIDPNLDLYKVECDGRASIACVSDRPGRHANEPNSNWPRLKYTCHMY